ncbi:MAG: hypothetical protein IKT34_03760 [Clostridia bacterium]|nr:hypothetical protein [Clostridia bacterium]
MPKANGINLTATERQHLADAFDAIMGVASEFGPEFFDAYHKRGGDGLFGELEKICIKTKRNNCLNNYVINDRAENNGKKSESKILEYLAENSFTDNYSGKTDNDCTLTLLNICKALILCEKCTCKCNKAV